MGEPLNDTQISEWHHVASLETNDGVLTIFDPCFYNRGGEDPTHVYDMTLQGPPGKADVFLERSELRPQDWRNLKARIIMAEGTETSREVAGDVGVDSGQLAIAVPNRLLQNWLNYGPKAKISIWVGFRAIEKGESDVETAKAVKLLTEAGYKTAPNQYMPRCYDLIEQLDDKDIKRANTLLEEAGIAGKVGLDIQHSLGLIHEQWETTFAALLDDPAKPYLVAFEPGWGDGCYTVFALKDGDRTFGFECVFIEPDSEDEDDESLG